MYWCKKYKVEIFIDSEMLGSDYTVPDLCGDCEFLETITEDWEEGGLISDDKRRDYQTV